MENSPLTARILPKRLERLQQLTEEHGWTLDQAMRRALEITELVLGAKDEPESSVHVYNAYAYKEGKRYSLEIE